MLPVFTSSYLKKPKDTAATSVVVTSLLPTTAMAEGRPDHAKLAQRRVIWWPSCRMTAATHRLTDAAMETACEKAARSRSKIQHAEEVEQLRPEL